MYPSLYIVPAALIGVQTSLQLGHSYLLDWSSGSATGHIHSITRRLPSPFVAISSASCLRPREMACVEIALSSSTPLAGFKDGVQQVTVVEPLAKKIAGSGLLIPLRAQDKAHSRPAAVSQGLTVWLTGLSGAGKTTIAHQVQDQLRFRCAVEMLDADVVRTYLCKDLGYSKEDRDENVRRLGFVADLLTQKRMVVLITAIAPYRAMRDEVRRTIGRYVEVYVNAPLAVCEERDVKGLYKRARAGEIRSFTGIDDPYEAPLAPEVECRTDSESIEVSVSKVVAAIEQKLRS